MSIAIEKVKGAVSRSAKLIEMPEIDIMGLVFFIPASAGKVKTGHQGLVQVNIIQAGRKGVINGLITQRQAQVAGFVSNGLKGGMRYRILGEGVCSHQEQGLCFGIKSNAGRTVDHHLLYHLPLVMPIFYP